MFTVKQQLGRYYIYYIVVLTLLLSGCSISSLGLPVVTHEPIGAPTSTPIPVTFDNEGAVCISALAASALRINAMAGKSDLCWPSSCTLVLNKDYDIEIDQENFTIQFTWHVVARENYVADSYGMVACTADCGGPGQWSWEYETEDLSKGKYSIKIGEKMVGTLDVPPLNPVCFDSYEEAQESPLPTPPLQSILPTPTP